MSARSISFALALLTVTVRGWRKRGLCRNRADNVFLDSCEGLQWDHAVREKEVSDPLKALSSVLFALHTPLSSIAGPNGKFSTVRSVAPQKLGRRRVSASRIQMKGGEASEDVASLAAASLRDSYTGDSQVLRKLVRNQLLVGIPIWIGSFGAQALANSLRFDDALAVFLGLVGATGLVALGTFIEKSDARIFSDLNVATKLTVLQLFGTKSLPLMALIVSVALCALTGVVEETIFRGGVLPSIAQWAVDNGLASTLEEGEPLGLLASSILFGLGHISPALSFDTLVLFGLQILTGLSFGSLFVLTGNLLAPIIAHFIYDLYTLYETHLSVTDQIAYAESAPMPESSSESNWRQLKGDKFVNEARQAYCLMDTNRDGQISPGELRMAVFTMGLRPDETQFQAFFEQADLDGSGKIDFDEFLEYLSKSEADATEAAKGFKLSLLGVRT